MILGIETSCDETAAALVTVEGEIRSSVVSSQAELHARYGGVVPEIASRRHLELVSPVVQEALVEADAGLDDVQSVAVTQGPGLIGALLVGLSAAKALAWARGLPLVPVDHLHGHVASLYLGPNPSSRRFSACSQAAVTRCCSRCATTRATACSAHRSTTLQARRSTRAPVCSASATRWRRDRPVGAGRGPRGVLVPSRAARWASTSRSRA